MRFSALTLYARMANGTTRWFYTRWYARQMHVPHTQLQINARCVIHGGGSFRVGRGVVIRSSSRQPVELYCAPDATLVLGDNSFLNQGVHIACSRQVTIEDHCLLGDEVLVLDSDFHGAGGTEAKSSPIWVKRGAWIGARAIILKGVTIGEEAVVGAGAVVTRSVPARSLAVGNPVQIIRQW